MPQFRPELEAGSRALCDFLEIDPDELRTDSYQSHEFNWQYYCQAAIALLKAVPVSEELEEAMHDVVREVYRQGGVRGVANCQPQAFVAAVHFLTGDAS